MLRPLTNDELKDSKRAIVAFHYTHSIPSGKSWYFRHGEAVVCFSIPANKNIARFILGRQCVCLELARLWAPDGHARNLLTSAISQAAIGLRAAVPDLEVLVSYADPNVGHEGFVYRAASWVYTGKSEDPRGYVDADGRFFPRRRFHSGGHGLTKAQIEARGYKQVVRDGKHRFARGLTRHARCDLLRLWGSLTS